MWQGKDLRTYKQTKVIVNESFQLAFTPIETFGKCVVHIIHVQIAQGTQATHNIMKNQVLGTWTHPYV